MRLGLDLRTLFREAVETGRTVTRDSVAVEGDDGRVQLVNLTVDPLPDHDGGDPHYLICARWSLTWKSLPSCTAAMRA